MMTMRQRMESGKLFTDMCEGLPEERMAAKERMVRFNALSPRDTAEREMLLGEIFGITPDCWIEPPFHFCYGRHISIGSGSYINMNCNFIDDGKITIGKNVLIGPAVTIATVGHPIAPDLREYMYCDAVSLGDNCWIGANTVILPGVTIGDNSVIGAGSVVTKDIPANVVAFGSPCHVFRQINEYDEEYYFKGHRFADQPERTDPAPKLDFLD